MEPEERYIPNHANPLLKVSNATTHLLTSLTKLVTSVPPVNPWPQRVNERPVFRGLFRGPTSIAYLFLNLTKTHPSLLIANETPKYWCLAYLDCGQDFIPLEPAEWDKRPQDIGIANEYLNSRCVKAAITQDATLAESVIQKIKETDVVKEQNEHLRGRAGALSIFRFLKHWLPETTSTADPVITSLIETMLENDKPWTFGNVRYLGAVHGDIGNFTQILLSDPSYAPKLEKRLRGLLDMQLPSGGWPIAEPSEGKRVWDLIHFCHGAPGFVLSLISIRHLYSDEMKEKIDRAIQRGRKLIWEKGILNKHPCLCHGVVGNALALEGEQREHFMTFATEEVISRHIAEGLYQESEEPWGLTWGEAGRAWGWMVLDSEIEGYPGYSDI